MGMGEKTVAQALQEVALRIIFGEHGLGSLEQVDVAFGIHRDGRGFSGNHVFGPFEKIGHDAIRQLGNGLE